MNIPNEAVEAAAKVFYEGRWTGPPFWESLDADDPSRLEYLATTRAALEAAAPHMQIEELLSGVQRDIDAVKTMADVLVDHQRQNSSSCLCGWAKLGHSHSEHQADALAAAGFGLVTNPYRSQA